MGYLISQIVMCLLLAGIAGGIIGYFLKQFWSSNTLQQVDTMWSEKVRAVTRDLEASRAETKVHLLKTEDLEQAQLDSVRQLKTAQQQVSTANQKSAHLQTELAGKMVTISAQEGSIRDWKTRLEAELKKAVERDAALAGKDTAIQNVQDELAAAAKVSGAQDLQVKPSAHRSRTCCL